MKLAMREAENQKLQAARQRDTAGVSLSSSGTMDGLRSELTALVEKNKIGEHTIPKQQTMNVCQKLYILVLSGLHLYSLVKGSKLM